LSQDTGGQVVVEKVTGNVKLAEGFFEEFVMGIDDLAHGKGSVTEENAAANPSTEVKGVRTEGERGRTSYS
jgi:hypothetical protein